MKTRVLVVLKAKEERALLQGFPWVYDNEISHVVYDSSGKRQKMNLNESPVASGDFVDIYTHAGALIGCGIVNKHSKIAVRLFANASHEKLDGYIERIVKNRIEQAVFLRRNYYTDSESCRLIFGEADLLFGLIVDRFVSVEKESFLVVQFHSLACEQFRVLILQTLITLCNPNAIIERSDESIRLKEGLSLCNGVLYMRETDDAPHSVSPSHTELDNFTNMPPMSIKIPPIVIQENEVIYYVDLLEGQKTGFFLDQKYNRKALTQYCQGKKVLDACSHTGGFALNAAIGGACSVTAIEISEQAVQMIQKNAELNGLANRVLPICANVFDMLKQYETNGERFDVIILDPPAFAKSVKSLKKAYSGYKEINLRAIKLLNNGGVLVTCSCSGFFDETYFYKMLTEAATDCKVHLQILEKRGAAPDHPVLLGYPHSQYLKCAFVKVIRAEG